MFGNDNGLATGLGLLGSGLRWGGAALDPRLAQEGFAAQDRRRTLLITAILQSWQDGTIPADKASQALMRLGVPAGQLPQMRPPQPQGGMRGESAFGKVEFDYRQGLITREERDQEIARLREPKAEAGLLGPIPRGMRYNPKTGMLEDIPVAPSEEERFAAQPPSANWEADPNRPGAWRKKARPGSGDPTAQILYDFNEGAFGDPASDEAKAQRDELLERTKQRGTGKGQDLGWAQLEQRRYEFEEKQRAIREARDLTEQERGKRLEEGRRQFDERIGESRRQFDEKMGALRDRGDELGRQFDERMREVRENRALSAQERQDRMDEVRREFDARLRSTEQGRAETREDRAARAEEQRRQYDERMAAAGRAREEAAQQRRELEEFRQRAADERQRTGIEDRSTRAELDRRERAAARADAEVNRLESQQRAIDSRQRAQDKAIQARKDEQEANQQFQAAQNEANREQREKLQGQAEAARRDAQQRLIEARKEESDANRELRGSLEQQRTQARRDAETAARDEREADRRLRAAEAQANRDERERLSAEARQAKEQAQQRGIKARHDEAEADRQLKEQMQQTSLGARLPARVSLANARTSIGKAWQDWAAGFISDTERDDLISKASATAAGGARADRDLKPGYRWADTDRTRQEWIPGGPADPTVLAAQMQARRGEGGEKALTKLGKLKHALATGELTQKEYDAEYKAWQQEVQGDEWGPFTAGSWTDPKTGETKPVFIQQKKGTTQYRIVSGDIAPKEGQTGKMTEGEMRAGGNWNAATYANRRMEALGNVRVPFSADLVSDEPGLSPAMKRYIARSTQNPAEQQSIALARQFIIALAHGFGGARVTEEQFRKLWHTYIPEPGDTEETVREKASMRRNELDSLKVMAGRAGEKIEQQNRKKETEQGINDPLGIRGK